MGKSLKSQITLATAGCLFIAVVIAVLISSYLHYSYLKKSVQSKLVLVATTIATHIDPVEHESFQSPKDMELDSYKKAVGRLNSLLVRDHSVRFIYTMRQRKISEKKYQYEFVLDGGSKEYPPGSESKDFSKIGDVYDEITKDMIKIFKTGKPFVESQVVQDRWGWTISGYAPLKNKEGKVIAVVGVDMTANVLAKVMSTIFFSASLAAVASALLGILFASRLMSVLMQPLDLLSRAAERVAAGNLKEPINAKREDELALVFQTFNRMMISISESRRALLQKARLEAEMKLAAAVQNQLFQWEDIRREDVSLGHYVQMADSTGGDWAHYHMAQQRYLYMICGDVLGHGLPSALVVSAVAGCFESLKTDLERPENRISVGEIMQRFHFVVKAAGGGNFPMSMFLIELDLVNGNLNYSFAGHPPARIVTVNSDGKQEVRRLTGRSDYLGGEAFDKVYTESDRLVPGDYIVLFSDGLTERRDSGGRQFGSGRLDRLLRKSQVDNPNDLCSMIIKEVSRFAADSHVDDDISLMAAQYIGSAVKKKSA